MNFVARKAREFVHQNAMKAARLHNLDRIHTDFAKNAPKEVELEDYVSNTAKMVWYV